MPKGNPLPCAICGSSRMGQAEWGKINAQPKPMCAPCKAQHTRRVALPPSMRTPYWMTRFQAPECPKCGTETPLLVRGRCPRCARTEAIQVAA